MKHHTSLFFNLFLLISSLFLSACGGSSSGSGAVNTDTDRPQFFREKATSSPSYSPSGETTDTTPTFSWKAINNATDYQIGHEGTEDASTWHEYGTTPSEAGCEQVGSTCTLTPSDYTFPLNVEKVWWVRAKVNGDWQDWSSPIIFTVVSGGSNADIPKLIEPINNEAVFDLNSFGVHWLKVRDKSGNFLPFYKVGFENADTGENWQEHDINCYRMGTHRPQPEDCSASISVNGFTYGQNIAWWVKAKVDGEWGEWSEWSEAGTFTISSNTNTAPKIIEPIIVTNSVYLNLKWSRVVTASEYRIATEDADTGENYHLYNNPYGLKCLIGKDFCSLRIKFPSGENLNWWVQAKINGEWGEWSDVGYISTQFSSVNNIPDEIYKSFCHVYENYPPIVKDKLDLIDGIIINEKRYFINPTDKHTIKISNLDGTNEHSVATFDMKSGGHLIPISKNGALFVHIYGKGVFLIRENNPPLQVVKALDPKDNFVYTKNYVFYMFKVFSRHHPAYLALRRVSLTGDETTLVSNHKKGIDESNLDVFYSKEEGNLYFLNIDNYNRRIGRIDDNGEIEYLSSCQ